MPDNPFQGAPKRVWLIAGVAGLGVAGYMWWKHKQNAATAATTTGYGYGAPTTGYGGYGYGVSSIFGYGQGGFPPFPSGYQPTSYGYQSQFPTPTTNAQWFQEATNWLTQGGTTFSTAEAALGKYLAGAPVTADQALIIQEAEGALGPPPVSGANGYPPNINTSTHGGGGNATNPVTGLKMSQGGTTGVDVSWSASSGATSYKVTSSAGNPTLTGPTSARIHSINAPGKGGKSATVTVLAEPAAAHARAASITVHTHK